MQSSKENSSDFNQLAAGSLVNIIGRFGGLAFHIVANILLARYLGPDKYGLYSIGWSYLQVLVLIAVFGLDFGVIRFGSKYWQDQMDSVRGVIKKSLGLGFVISSIGGIALFALSPMVSRVIGKPEIIPIIKLFSFSIPILVLLRVSSAATRISQRMRYSILAEEIIRRVSFFIFVVIIAVIGFSVVESVLAVNGALLLGLAVSVYYVRKLFGLSLSKKGSIEKSVSRELISFSMQTMVATFISGTLIWVDRLFIGYFQNSADAGIYQAVVQTATFLPNIRSSLNMIIAPMASNLYAKKEMGRLREIFRASTKWGIYLSVPLAVVLIFYAEEFMSIIYGADYRTGAIPLIILAIAQLINVATGGEGVVLMMTENQGKWLKITLVTLVINVALNSIFVPRLGIIGASIASGVSLVFLVSTGLFSVWKLLGFHPYDRKYLKIIISSVFSIVCVLGWIRYGWFDGLLQLVIVALISVFSFFIILWIFGFDEEDRIFISYAKERLRRK